MSDPINPNHYKHLPVEAIDIIDAAIEGAPSPQAAAAQSHLLGYALRANQKGQLAIDAGKAEWYAARWLKAIREAEAKASGASETQIDEPTTEPPDGWRWVEVGENFRVADTLNTIDRIPDNWIGTACVVKHCAFRKVEEPTRFYREPTQTDLASGANETPIDEPSDETDRDDHPHDFKVGDAVISWQGREGIIEAIGLIDDFPITVRHSIREQVSYKLGGVKKRHDDHPVETEPWKPKIGERVIYTPSGSLWTVDRELKEKPRDGVTYILKDGTFTLRACLSRLAPIEPPKRFYRDPTLEDLNNGPIECEYRNSKSEHWQGGLLVHILDSANPFLCVSKAEQLSNQWRQCRIQCRIEVAE